MQIDITQIVLALITLFSGIITSFVIPFLKKKLTGQQMENLKVAARIAVYAAEQLFTPEQWAEKKKYAQDILAAQGYKVDSEKVDAAIEAEVLALHDLIKAGDA